MIIFCGSVFYLYLCGVIHEGEYSPLEDLIYFFKNGITKLLNN